MAFNIFLPNFITIPPKIFSLHSRQSKSPPVTILLVTNGLIICYRFTISQVKSVVFQCILSANKKKNTKNAD